LKTAKLEPRVIEDILDRPATVSHTLKVLEAAKPEDARRIAFWFIHGEPPVEDIQEGASEIEVNVDKLVALSAMVDEGKLSSTAARSVFDEMVKSNDEPQTIAQRLNLLQVSDEAELEKIVTEVLKDNPKVVADVKAGEHKAIGFLVGQVMKKSAGKANPGLAQKIIKKQLEV
jgi:aspartyl-tRNA(Asn)/glutamyl-tRNA(Gln) amidotransferase subunit B